MRRVPPRKAISETVRLGALIFLPLFVVFGGLVLTMEGGRSGQPGAGGMDRRWVYGLALVLLAVLAGRLGQLLSAGRRAQRQVQRGRFRSASLFNEAPVGYHEVDLDGRILRVNRTELELMGYSAEEMIGRPVWEFVEVEPEERRQFETRLRRGKPAVVRYERIRRRKDGSTFVSLSETRPLTDESGGLTGFRTTVRDISSIKELQAELLSSRRAEAVSVLAGGIAHDFNNLLGIVYGYLNLVRLDIDCRDEALCHIGKAEQGLRDARQLCQKLMQLTGGAGAERVRVALERELGGWIADLVKRPGIRLVCNFLERLHPISADREKMRLALRHLVRNAVEAMPKGGVVQIDAANLSFSRAEDFPELGLSPGNYVVVTVRDQGKGMPPEVLDHLFDVRFSEGGHGSGNGLGLAVTAAVLRKHGGRIKIESELGVGTKCRLYLPAADNGSGAGRERARCSGSDRRHRADPLE